MKIEFISDVSCPWCAIGLNALEQALRRVGPEIQAEIHFEPFELNPQMPAEGQDVVEHLTEKYRISPEQVASNTEAIRQRGAEVGFEFGRGMRRRVYNTRAAHRLLHWAGLQSATSQRALKHALFKAYFTDGLNPGDHDLLVQLAAEAGLDGQAAAEVLASQRYDAEVAEAEHQWHANGISAVPSIVINDKYLISGGQPAEQFERALRQIASEATATG
jgi:predicted DsbA family dithiol-disulfide isomerase